MLIAGGRTVRPKTREIICTLVVYETPGAVNKVRHPLLEGDSMTHDGSEGIERKRSYLFAARCLSALKPRAVDQEQAVMFSPITGSSRAS